MAVGAIEFNGMVTRQQDFQNIKTAEDQKPIVDSQNYQIQVEKNAEANTGQVHKKDEAALYDGSDQGSNEYSGDGGKKRKKKDENKDGRVINKSVRSFDVKI